MGWDGARGRDGRDRRADARLRRRHATSGSAAAGLQWPVAPDGTDAPILYEHEFDLPGRPRRTSPRCPTRRPATHADEEFPLILVTGRRLRALQRRHDDPPHRQPRADRPRLAGDPPRRRRARSGSTTATSSRCAAASGGSSSQAQVTERIEPRPRLHRRSTSPRCGTNLLIGQSADVNTSCPEYKVDRRRRAPDRRASGAGRRRSGRSAASRSARARPRRRAGGRAASGTARPAASAAGSARPSATALPAAARPASSSSADVEALGEPQLEHDPLDAARRRRRAARAPARARRRRRAGAAYVAGCSTFHQRTPPTWLCAPGPTPHQSPPRQ